MPPLVEMAIWLTPVPESVTARVIAITGFLVASWPLIRVPAREIVPVGADVSIRTCCAAVVAGDTLPARSVSVAFIE